MNRPIKVVVVGGVAAGPSAAAKARRTNPQADVVLFEAGEDVSYGVCELPYLISGELASPEDLIVLTPEALAEKKEITVHTQHRVTELRPTQRTIVVHDLRTGGLREERYDKLILATGTSPRALPQIPMDAENCFHYSNLDWARKTLDFLERERPGSVCIVGAGFIGIEAAESFRSRGMAVTLIHNEPLPLPGMETEGRALLERIVDGEGISQLANVSITGVESAGGRIRAVQFERGSSERSKVEADMFIVAVGFTPNVELANQARIRLGNDGAILTDQRQMTSIDGIYAAGDCAEVPNITTRKTEMMPFASIASKTGRVAGENAAGGAAAFKGAVPVSALSVFGYEIAQAGSPAGTLAAHGLKPVTEFIKAKTRVGFMPGAEPLLVTLSADARTRRILNGNIIAKEFAALRMNAVSLAIRHKLTVEDFLDSDFIYTPRLAPLWDPLLICAQQLQKKLK